jgi:peptidoglycan/xylan/chitin deacetylase (PgdA/CDA1 family)
VTPPPPGGLETARTPQFVVLTSDDNGFSGRPGSGSEGGLAFFERMLDGRSNPGGSGEGRTFDGAPVTASYFVVTRFLEPGHGEDPSILRAAWRQLHQRGHEIAVHTHTHPHGHRLDADQWREEMNACRERLTASPEEGGVGIPRDEVTGFRAPYLEYNPAALAAAEAEGFAYDSSIEEGFQEHEDGRNFVWPYRLSDGSPGDRFSAREHQRGAVGSHPALWEIPVYAWVVPPDDRCDAYGVEPGLRQRLAGRAAGYDPAQGRITGFDWNLWVAFGMARDEFVATVKHTLDLRLEGNRCPLVFGLHSDIYSTGYDDLPASSVGDRQSALEEAVEHALAREPVRMVAARHLVAWLEDPQPLVPHPRGGFAPRAVVEGQ